MSPSTNIASEREYHNELFRKGDFTDPRRIAQLKYYWAIQKGSDKYWDSVKQNARGAAALAYGCGLGHGLSDIVPIVQSLVGIDISDVAIAHAQNRFGSPAASFRAMDGMNLDFADCSFDLVFGSGIIHHLDVSRSMTEICRVLKPAGKAIFWEPLGVNPLINAYRLMTPNARTPDEHPLLPNALREMGRIASDLQVEYFGLSTLFAMPFYRTRLGPKILPFFESIDDVILKVPGLRMMAWYCLITLTK